VYCTGACALHELAIAAESAVSPSMATLLRTLAATVRRQCLAVGDDDKDSVGDVVRGVVEEHRPSEAHGLRPLQQPQHHARQRLNHHQQRSPIPSDPAFEMHEHAAAVTSVAVSAQMVRAPCTVLPAAVLVLRSSHVLSLLWHAGSGGHDVQRQRRPGVGLPSRSAALAP
jgi:hypothetical protein